MNDISKEKLKEIIRARLSRTRIYLEYFLKDLPPYTVHLKHRFQHPLSELYILVQQLDSHFTHEDIRPFIPPQKGVPNDINYFERALNELRTALIYFQQRKVTELFVELEDYYFEQKLTTILNQLLDIKKSL